jgi:hypothetical protein
MTNADARRMRDIILAATAIGFCFGLVTGIIAYSTGFLP